MANKRTVLYEQHVAQGARMVDFGGWDMPLHYGSQIEEHHAVRGDAGMFDVSHMTVVDLRGDRVRAFLGYLLANNVARLTTPGRAMYSCMLNENGGVIDDLITYFLDESWFRVVVNAATRDRDMAWIVAQSKGFEVEVHERPDLAMIAVQGPAARDKAASVLPSVLRDAVLALKPFNAHPDGAFFVARTGYTGEDGFEIIVDGALAGALWEKLVEAGVRPCGLGARDTLRLEAGLHLYGSDMNEDSTPLEAGLAWTVAFEPAGRNFIGRRALEENKARGIKNKLVGLLLEGRGVLRGGQRVYVDAIGEGVVTSGTFSPTLKRSIGLAHVPAGTGERCEVEIRGARLAASVHKPTFVRNGKAKIEL